MLSSWVRLMLLVLAVIGYGEGGVGSDDGVFKISFFYKLFWVLSGGVSTLGIWALEVFESFGVGL